MVKRVFAICGLILFLGSVGVALYLFTFYVKAVTLDNNYSQPKVAIVNNALTPILKPTPTPSPTQATSTAQANATGTISPQAISTARVQAAATQLATNLTSSPIIPPCLTSWKLDIPNRVISENDSLVLRVILSNAGNPKTCIVTISLNASGFDLDIPIREKRVGLFPNETTRNVLWILTPTKPGSFQLGVSLESVSLNVNGPVPLLLDTQVIGVTVTNTFGLSPWQVQLLSYLGVILGPALSLAWLYDKWHEHKVSKEKNASLVKKDKAPAKPKQKPYKKR